MKFKKPLLIVGAILLMVSAYAYAQEAQRFFQSVEFHAGRVFIGKGATGFLQFDGATADSNVTTIAPTDPTSSRTLTLPDQTGTMRVNVTENVTATNVITASECGSTFLLNSATEFVSTLPAPSAGCEFEFIVAAAPSGASYTIITTSSSNIIKGLQLTAQDAGGSGDSGTADDTVTLVDGQAVAGDRVVFRSDGTSWFAYGYSKVLAGLTFTQAS